MGILGFGSRSDSAGGTALDDRVKESEKTLPTEEGDHDRFSHYVPKDELTEAMVMGTPVIALCGKVWVPTRDGAKYPVCPDCKEAWESFGDDKGNDKGNDKGSGE